MTRRTLRLAAVAGFALVAMNAAWGFTAIVVSPLKPQPVPSKPFFRATGKSVSVVAVDAREDKSFIADALIGAGAESDKGVFMGYGTPSDDDLAAFVGKAASDALPVLGYAVGSDLSLTITMRELRVDMYRTSGFSPMNCMAYAVVEVSLVAGEGVEPKRKTLRLAYYENTTPVMSMKEVTEGALSRVYSQLGWEAAAAALLDEAGPEPDAAAIASFAAALPGTKDEVAARGRIFWLGIARQPLPAVKEALDRMFRAEGEQKVYQASVEALGKLGVEDVRETIEGILAGTRKVGDWDNEDDEHVWYLMRALADLGERDLAARVPDTKLRMPSKLQDLIGFETAGTVPKISPAGAAKLEEAKKKLGKKRK